MATRAEIRDEIASNIEQLREMCDQHLRDTLAQQTGDLIEKLPVSERKLLKIKVRHAVEGKAWGGAEKLEAIDYAAVPGVMNLVQRGTKLVTSSVGAYIKAADLAKDLAAVLLDIRKCVRNKQGLPDLMGTTMEYRAASHAIYTAAGKQIAKNTSDAKAVSEAVDKLARAVRRQMSAQTVEYIKGLNRRKAEFRKAFPAAAEQYPHLTPAEAVYALYEAKGIRLPKMGGSQRAILKWRGENNQLTGTADQVRAAVMSMSSLTPDAVRELPDDEKRAVRRELDDTLERIKALIQATL
ncbi:hypothetical protein [Streptomyces lycii]|uniref:Uncharacterized protein n=1 Tax=Streptomyces lycii TaxID=2654337 RepID=A0ABQ7FI91_9ACTN|nr:hypothetical protein [Streptomyces lycii]KAF4408642.1 hypothetical protein GCU69_13160 [Streptomyces lycii]